MSRRIQLLLSSALLAGAGYSASAQTGSITGQVLDPGTAAVPNAKVTATSESTGFTTSVTTTSAGVYNFGALPPAVYTVNISAEGFQEVTRRGVVLNIAATLPLNFKLAVAGSNTSIEVSDVPVAPIETDSFQVSTVIDAKQISDLPLILRDPYQLTLLAPGVVTSTNNDGGFSVNGQRDRNNNFMLDGADNNDTSVPGGTGLSSANPDSAQEFRVITNNFDAEFGRNTGAIVDVITRGGTNRFHGDAYEFGRYNALGARDFFNTKANGPQDPYVRNDFGASVGGPLWKDHTFFFLNGEVQRFRTTRTENTTTPTAAYRTGNFTYIDPTDGSSTVVNLNQPGNPNNLTGLGADPTAVRLLNLAPVGQADNGDGVSTNYFFPSPDALNSYTLTGRFDQRLTDKQQLTVRYIYGHSNESDPFHDEVIPGYGQTAVIGTTHNGAISLASTVSANSTNLLRASYNLNNAGFFCNHAAIDAAVGTDGFGNGRDITFPGFFNGNAFGCYDLGDSNGQARFSSTLLFGDTYSIVKGKHSLKFGGEFRNVKDSSFDDFSSRLAITLNNYSNFAAPAWNYAGDPNSPGLLNFEDYVWGAQGVVSNNFENQFFDRNGARRGSDLTRFTQREWDVFAQDTWKITPKFTAILGMRYAFNGVPFERDGNFSNFYGDSSMATPADGFSFTNVGPGTGRQLYKDSWALIEPRVGFAYDLTGDGKTALRGGYGIFHDRIFDNVFGNSRSNPPFQAQLNTFPFTGDATSPTLTNSGFPGALTPSATITDGDYFEPVTIDGNLKIPTSQSWNIGVQRQISPRLVLEVNYVGNHGTHGLRELDRDPPQPALVSALLAAGVPEGSLRSTALYFGGSFTSPLGSSGSFNPAVYNTAFYHNLFQTSVVGSNYNALQTRVQGQIGGLTITASYSYAHSLDDGSDPLVPGAGGSALPRNPFNLRDEYGNSDADVRHRGTISAVYELPIGVGQNYLNHGILGHVFEGIEISGIQQAQTGLPFDLRGTRDNLHTSVNNRPQLVGKPYPANRGQLVAAGRITGPSMTAFANPTYDQDVSIHRNGFSGPGFVNTDAVFQKTQTLREGVKLVLRAESYNVLNHPNMSSPDASSLVISSPTFGVSTSQVGQNDGTTGARQIQGAVKVVF